MCMCNDVSKNWNDVTPTLVCTVSILQDLYVHGGWVVGTVVVSGVYAHEVLLLFLRQPGIILDSSRYVIVSILEPINVKPIREKFNPGLAKQHTILTSSA